MASKLVVQQHLNEPRWHLDGKLADTGGHLARIRNGFEIHGRLDTDGDEPPGIPVFEYILEGKEHREVVEEGDLFRWPTERESEGTKQFVVRNLKKVN